MSYKIPVSVLVVIHTLDRQVLLLERARRGFWQSVTGSLDWPDEPLEAAAAREVKEETGIDASAARLRPWNMVNRFEIYLHWRHRFAPGVTHNTEHVFGLAVRAALPVTTAPDEHVAFAWMPWEVAAEKCFSWSNRDAIRMLGESAA